MHVRINHLAHFGQVSTYSVTRKMTIGKGKVVSTWGVGRNKSARLTGIFTGVPLGRCCKCGNMPESIIAFDRGQSDVEDRVL